MVSYNGWPGILKIHILAAEFFYQRKTYRKANEVRVRSRQWLPAGERGWWGEGVAGAGSSWVRVLSLGLSFLVLPHPAVPDLFLRKLAAQCKMLLTHGH